jgi:SAM-dependent methyltransferase
LLNKVIQYFLGNQITKQIPLWCPICGTSPATFLPLPEIYRENASRYGFEHFEKGEMLSVDAYSCSVCGASDRERLYALWIDQQLEQKLFSNKTSIIHFAPESALFQKFKGLSFSSYKTADLLMDHADYKVDMMDMPFQDESFDFFICSHVLEHVESDDKALSELFRITKEGGCGILMVPIIMGLDATLEDPSVTDEANRYRLFGQNDHVRLYARKDYIKKINSHGFRVEELGENYFGKDVFFALGLTPTSVLYIVHK